MGGFPQINSLSPKIWERVGADPPILGKMLYMYSICIECHLSVVRAPLFLGIEGDLPLKIWNLDTTLLATNWWQAITWTDDDKIFVAIWCHQASVS